MQSPHSGRKRTAHCGPHHWPKGGTLGPGHWAVLTVQLLIVDPLQSRWSVVQVPAGPVGGCLGVWDVALHVDGSW
eukprot:1424490-Alexandrium_andersonii.AAC.1